MNEMQEKIDDVDEVKKWLDRITSAEKKWNTYHDLIKEIRDYYKNEKKKNKQNIFWSSVETLKPFIYFKPPVPYVERKSKVLGVGGVFKDILIKFHFVFIGHNQ